MKCVKMLGDGKRKIQVVIQSRGLMCMKKIINISLILILIFLVGCSKKAENSSSSEISNNRAKITIYMDEGQRIDNKYAEDNDIAINYLPKKSTNFTKDDVDKISSNIDKNVKLVIVSTENEGLVEVFKSIKSKIPGVITVFSNIKEASNEKRASVLKDENIDVGFLTRKTDSLSTAKLAKVMGAKAFLYLSSISDEDRAMVEDFCKTAGMEFREVEFSDSKNLASDKDFEELSKKYGRDIAIYSPDEKYSERVYDFGLENKLILPNINSEDDGRLLAKKLGLNKELEEKSRVEFDKAVSKKFKNLGMGNRVAGVSDGKKNLPIGLTIDIAKYMYENNFLIEECFRDISVDYRSNRDMDIDLIPERLGTSLGYIRTLGLSPRIY